MTYFPASKAFDIGNDSAPEHIDPSITSIFEPDLDDGTKSSISTLTPEKSGTRSYDLSWYPAWLATQLRLLPSCISDLFNNHDLEVPRLIKGTEFFTIFMEVNRLVRHDSYALGIDDVVQQICIQMNWNEDEGTDLAACRLLVFAILGWQTMLYSSAFNTCSLEEFAVQQDEALSGSRVVFHTYKISANLSDRPLGIMMKAFGNLLPAPSHKPESTAVESGIDHRLLSPIDYLELNVYTLHTLLRVDIRWVDSMVSHLDYNKATKTLSLFRFPSFCVTMLHSTGTLHSFGSPDIDGPDPRAKREDIPGFLREILLSYRLLFGQSKQSRKLFRRFQDQNPSLTADSLLFMLCGKGSIVNQYVPQDRATYLVQRDFPILGYRIELLSEDLKGMKPRGWRDLLKDRRDTLQYWTFWLVAVFGVASLLLSLIQTVLAGLQYQNS